MDPGRRHRGLTTNPRTQVLPDLLPSAALPKLRVEGTANPRPPGTPCCLRTQGRELDSKRRPGPGLTVGVRTSGAGPSPGISGLLLLGPSLPSACSSDHLVSLCRLGDSGPRPRRGSAIPCMCPCLNCHHVFYIKKRIKKLLWNSMLCIYKRKIIKEKSEAINNQLKTGSKGGNLGERAGSSAERRGAPALRKLRIPASGASPGPAPPSHRGSDRGARSRVSRCPLWFLQEPESPAPGAGMAGDTEARESPWVPPPLLTVA